MSLFNYLSSKFFTASNELLMVISPEKARFRSIKKVMENYDMVREDNERFFSLLYLYFIEQRIHEIFGQNKIKILDLGCGHGRLAIPLAKKGHEVKGIDLSQKVIDRALKYAIEEQVKIEFFAGNIEVEVKKNKPETFDCIICTEVLYMLKDYEAVISDLVGLIKKGGVLFLSLRPKLFYILYFIINNDIEQAASLTLNDGHKYINNGMLNCQTKSEMVEIFKNNKLIDIRTQGIGVLSGIAGDPQAKFISPILIGHNQRGLLYQMEIKLSEQFCENGRYVLISGIKK